MDKTARHDIWRIRKNLIKTCHKIDKMKAIYSEDRHGIYARKKLFVILDNINASMKGYRKELKVWRRNEKKNITRGSFNKLADTVKKLAAKIGL
jgi:hypothetical protein